MHDIQPTLEHLDPATLALAPNIRRTDMAHVEADTTFLASVRDRGVIVPVSAHRTQDGTVTVTYGQRRTIAAVLTKRGTIPVLVYPQDPADLDRVSDQWAENEHRTAMTDADRTTGIEQMALLGLSAAQIAKRTGTTKADVTTTLAVAQSSSREAMSTHGLTIDQATVLAQFEDDQDVTADLLTAAAEGSFEHVAARHQRDRAEVQAIAEATERLTAEGVSVIPRPGYDDKTAALRSLVDSEGTDLTAEGHAGCPGHVAYVDYRPYGQDSTHVVYACTDPRAHGHRDRYNTGGTTRSGPMSEEEKAERRQVVANNKAWDAATGVRREFLAKMAARKTPPAGTEALVAAALTHTGTHGSTKNPGDAWQALGLDGKKITREVTAKATTAKRHQVIALALTLGQWEADADRHTWRNPSAWDARVLGLLVTWGYQASEVEQTVIDHT